MADFADRLAEAQKRRAAKQDAKKKDRSFWENVGDVYSDVMNMPTAMAAGLPRFGIGLGSDLIETARLPGVVLDAAADRLGAPEWLQDTLAVTNPLNIPANVNDWVHGRDPEDQLDKISTFDSDTNRFSEVVNEVAPNLRGILWDSPGNTGKRIGKTGGAVWSAGDAALEGDAGKAWDELNTNPYSEAFNEGELPAVVLEDVANVATVAGLAAKGVSAVSKAATAADAAAKAATAAEAAAQGGAGATAAETAARAAAGAADDVAVGGVGTITEDAARAAAQARQLDDAIRTRVADAPKIEEAAHQINDITQPGPLEQTLAVSDDATQAAIDAARARAETGAGYTGWDPGRVERWVGEQAAPYADQLQVVADRLGGFHNVANRVADAPLRLPYEGAKYLGRTIERLAPESGGFVRGTVDAYGNLAARGAQALADRALRRAAQGTIVHAADAVREPFKRAAEETNDWLESELSPAEQQAIIQGRVTGVADGASPTTEAWQLAKANEADLSSRLPEDAELPWQQKARGAPDQDVLDVVAERERLRATPADQLTSDQVAFLDRMDEADYRMGLLYDVMQERRQIPYGESKLPPLEGTEAYDQWRATRTAEAGDAPIPQYVANELRSSDDYQAAVETIRDAEKAKLPTRAAAEQTYEAAYREYDGALKELDDLKIKQAQERGRLKNIKGARRDLEVAQAAADRAADRVRAAYQAAEDMAADWKYGQALGRMETTDVRPVPAGVAEAAARAERPWYLDENGNLPTHLRAGDLADESLTYYDQAVKAGMEQGEVRGEWGRRDKNPELYDSIRERGVEQPVDVAVPGRFANSGEKVWLGDGHHRVFQSADIDPDRMIPVNWGDDVPPPSADPLRAGSELYEGTVRPNMPEPARIPVRINGVDPRLDFPDSIAAAPVEGTPVHDVIPDAQVRVSLSPPEGNGTSPVATLAVFDGQALAEATANAAYPAAVFRWDTGTGEILMASTDARLQRQGVASSLLDTADGIAGSIGSARPVHSTDLTDAGMQFASASAERDMGRAIGNLRGMAEDRPLIGEAADLVGRQQQARQMVDFAEVNEQGRQYAREAEGDLRRESSRFEKLREQRRKWEEREQVKADQQAWDDERRLIPDREETPVEEQHRAVRDMRTGIRDTVRESVDDFQRQLEDDMSYSIGKLPKPPRKVPVRDPGTGRITGWSYPSLHGEWDWLETASPETVKLYEWASRNGRPHGQGLTGIDSIVEYYTRRHPDLEAGPGAFNEALDRMLEDIQYVRDARQFVRRPGTYKPGMFAGKLGELEDAGYDLDQILATGDSPDGLAAAYQHIRDTDQWVEDQHLQNQLESVQRQLTPLVDEQGIPRPDLTPDDWERAVDLTDQLDALQQRARAAEPPPLGSRPELPKGRFRNPSDEELAQQERFRDEAASRVAQAQGAFDPDAPSPAEAARSLEAANAEEQSYLRKIELEAGKVKPKLGKSKDAQLAKEQAAERLFVLEQGQPIPGADAVMAETPSQVFSRVKEAEATLDAVDAADNARARKAFIEKAAAENPANLPPDWRALIEENQRIDKVLKGQGKAFRDLGLDDAADHIDRVRETLPLTVEDAVAAGYEPKHIITGQKGIDAQLDLESQARLDARERAAQRPSMATKKVGSERMRDSGPFGDRGTQPQIAAMLDRHAVGTRNEAMRGLAERYRGAGDQAVDQILEDHYAQFPDELDAYEQGIADTLPEIDGGAVYDEMRRRGFMPVDPSTTRTVKRADVVLPTQDVLEAGQRPTVWIPEPIQKALEDAQEAVRPATKWERRYNKGLAYWKLTVLPLSPKWNIGNVIGNAFMAASTLKPGDLTLANFRETTGAIREPNQRQSRVMKQGLAQVDLGDALGDIDDAATGPRTAAGRAARSIPAASYKVNQYIDDFTHLFIYTAKRNEGIAFRNELLDQLQSGRITPEQFDRMIAEPPKIRDGGKRAWSDERAAQHALDIAGDFTNLTKGERRYIRRVMPFYPWYRHITKLVFRLPLENPYRVAWALHLAEQFGNDDDLPYWLRGAAPVGDYFLKGSWNPYPGGTPGESPVLNPVAAIGSTTPAIQWPAAAFGLNLGKGKPLTMSPASQTFDSEGRATVGQFIGLKNFAGYMTGQIPQLRLARDLASPAVARYDTGEVIKTRGRPLPLTGQDFGIRGVTAPNTSSATIGALGRGQIPSALLSFLTGATIDAPDVAELERLRARRKLENERAAKAYSRQ